MGDLVLNPVASFDFRKQLLDNAGWAAPTTAPRTHMSALDRLADRMPERLRAVRGQPNLTVHSVAHAPNLEQRLASIAMDLKAHVSLVAMHLKGDWRTGFFSQLDFLLDIENWEDEDDLPSMASFKTAVRLIIFLGSIRRPGLGLTHDGHIILSWTSQEDRLTIECLPDDRVKWVLSHWIAGQRESAAGLGASERVPAVLAAYKPDKWLALP